MHPRAIAATLSASMSVPELRQQLKQVKSDAACVATHVAFLRNCSSSSTPPHAVYVTYVFDAFPALVDRQDFYCSFEAFRAAREFAEAYARAIDGETNDRDALWRLLTTHAEHARADIITRVAVTVRALIDSREYAEEEALLQRIDDTIDQLVLKTLSKFVFGHPSDTTAIMPEGRNERIALLFHCAEHHN